MTAIVGTINRRGVAFAADSAATYTFASKSKITNNTNKIFALSKKHPVGVAIYNNLDFHGVPWENIFKMYRDDHLKDNSFDKLSQYADDFWRYVISDILPKLVEDQKRHVAIMANGLWNECFNTANDQINQEGITKDSKNLFDKIMLILKKISSDYSAFKRGAGFEDYSKEKLINYGDEIINKVLSTALSDTDCPVNFKDVFVDALFWIMMADFSTYLSYTGLVFWGYGETDLFPSYYEYHVDLAFDNHLKHVLTSEYEVSNNCNACVAPFAQTDVANTVVRGVDPSLRATITDGLRGRFDNFRNDIVDELAKVSAPQQLIDVLNGIDIDDKVRSFIDDLNKYISDHYTDKLLETVAMLSKEDLADMAESLVKMTCLKRHVTTDEETVGGPVDVAVITKGDGFIWIKRKHYFDPSLNHHYFEK